MSTRLSDKYSVKDRFRRSTRLDSDGSISDSLSGITLHDTGRHIVDRFLKGIVTGEQRSFTWSGPYGTGKSTLALFLASLLGPNQDLRDAAKKIYGKSRAGSKHNNSELLEDKWFVVRVTARRETTLEAITRSIDAAIKEFWPKNLPAGIKRIPPISSEDELFDALATISSAKNVGGILIIIDEMGKLLEHAASTNADLHLFQELAEMCARAEQPIGLLGILHQSFQEYAGRLDRKRRNEWAKVQGRFEDAPFSISIEESVDLVSQAISPKGKRKSNNLDALGERFLKATKQVRFSANKKLVGKLVGCAPLHPATVFLLPLISRQRFAQNERSIFSFLLSGEPRGFRDFLLSTPFNDESQLQLYPPDFLWDYLHTNLEQAILTSPISHRWAEAAEAVLRAQNQGNSEHVAIVKIIALLDLFGRQVSVYANPKLLSSASGLSEARVKAILKDLSEWSIVAFRKHLSAFVITSGSDVDIDAEVESARAQIATDLQLVISKIPTQQPVVAKRHYHERGTLRWFGVSVALSSDVSKLNTQPSKGDGDFVLVVFDQDGASTKAEELSSAVESEKPLLLGISPDTEFLIEHASEVAALARLTERLPELQTDSVARKEVSARLHVAQRQLEDGLKEALKSATWFLNGTEQASNGSLTKLASDVSDQTYIDTPVVRNELINRHRPSSSAVAGRRALMRAMVDRPHEPILGITKYPPEAGLYLSILKGSLHIEEQGRWKFSAPQGTGDDPRNFAPLWSAANQLLADRALDRSDVPLSSIYEIWSKPPFGVREGLLPLLALAYFMTRSDDLALYLEGAFEPRRDDYVVDRMLQSPTDLSLREVSTKGVQREVLNVVAELSEAQLDGIAVTSALDAAKHLVRFAIQLPTWVKRTNDNRYLTEEAIRVRIALVNARDPHQLFLDDLPKALGMSDVKSKRDVIEFRDSLSAAHDQLRSAFDRLLEDLRKETLLAFGCKGVSVEDLEWLRKLVRSVQAPSGEGRRFNTGDTRLDSALLRLQDSLEGNDWVESLAGLAARKPVKDWSDSHVVDAKKEIRAFGSQFRRFIEFHEDAAGDRGERFAVYRRNNERLGRRSVFVSQRKLNRAAIAEAATGVVNSLESFTDDEKIYALVEALEKLMPTETNPNFEEPNA